MMPDPVFLNIHMYGIMIAIGVLCAFATRFAVAGGVVFFIVRRVYRKAAKDETVS